MKFSLWMIRELFRDNQTELQIQESESRTIQNIRLFSSGTMSDMRSLYIESSHALFHDGDKAVICVHGNNILRIRSTSVNAVFNRVLAFFEECQIMEQKINRMITSNVIKIVKLILRELQKGMSTSETVYSFS